MTDTFDILLIGSGAAGLATALGARGKRVAVLTRGTLGNDGASQFAQGGIAAALAADDAVENHAADTLAAGGFRNDAMAVARLTRAAPATVAWLDASGLRFDRDGDGRLALGREAAHSHARIVHAGGDASGAELMRALRVAALAAPHISLFENCEATELLREGARVCGAKARTSADETLAFRAAHSVIATGGIGDLYRYTTNPRYADGRGLAIAARAGAALADLEFVQFHPTALATANDTGERLPLLSEALRGAGATLHDECGRRFLDATPGKELAARDVVARAVYAELQRGGRVFLDGRASIGKDFPQRFPSAFAACMVRGLDPREAPLPVVPAAHYHMGGIRVDGQGRSNLPGLYAVGEAAMSGVHGANRLASNSLLEAIAFGRELGMRLGASASTSAPARAVVETANAGRAEPQSEVLVARLRFLLWNAAGLRRNATQLRAALEECAELGKNLSATSAAADRLLVSTALLRAALSRRESVGAHYRTDFPPLAALDSVVGG